MKYTSCVAGILTAALLMIPISGSWAVWPPDGQAVCTSSNDQEYAFVIPDGTGGTISVWSDYRNGSWDVYAQRASACGQLLWVTDGVPICTALGGQLHGSVTNWFTMMDFRPIVSDGSGGAIIAWHDGRGSDLDVYVQRVDSDGNVLWPLDGVPIAAVAGTDEVYPTLMPDGAGGAFVAWNVRVGDSPDIYAQRVDADGNPMWAAGGIVICDAGRTQFRPKLVSDGADGTIIVWNDYRHVGTDIYGQRVDPSGNVLWAPNGIGIRVASGVDDSNPAVLADGAGGAIVAFQWQPWGGHPNHDIYAQRVDANGNQLWPAPGGVPIAVPSDSKQQSPGIVTDGTGGAIINWYDDRNGHWDIYAQRIDSTGAAQWALDGIDVCSASGLQGYPTNPPIWTKTIDMVSDDAGGAILSWHDFRGPNGDIYVQRIDGNGTELWTHDGVAICLAVGDQTTPGIVTDSDGGAIVAWSDKRSGTDNDIYAQRITHDGLIAGALVSISPAYDITNCITSKDLDFLYNALGYPEEARGYEITFSIDLSVVAINNPNTDITEGTFLSSVGTTLFFATDNGGGSYKVTCVIIGGSSGATGTGDLFHVNLTPVAEGTSGIVMTSVLINDINNTPIGPCIENGAIQVDCTKPTMEPIIVPVGLYFNTAPSFSNFGFDDDVNLDLADYQIDSDGWLPIFSDIDTTEYNDDGFILPGFEGLAEGSHTVYFRVKDDAGNWNGEGTPDTYSWLFYVDLTEPTMEPIVEAEGQHYKEAPTFSNFGFDDDNNLDLAQYQIDSNGWQTLFNGINTIEYNDDGYELPGFGGLAEGSHTVYFRVKDDAGNWNGEGTPDTYNWQFYKDTVAPDPPGDFLALPGNRKVHLTWANPTGDATFAGVNIRRVRWQDYPEYETAPPSYPASETEGDMVVQTDGEAYDDDPLPLRDINYYAAFAFDSAGNYSAFDAGAADRSTNYWLGDIDLTGEVDASDLVIFSGAFGSIEGGPGWVPESDFGPTEPAKSGGGDASRFGIPEPDDVIDFQDLMIFAMNYGNVTPLAASRYLAVEAPAELKGLVSFRIIVKDVGEVSHNTLSAAVMIENQAKLLKGFHLLVDYGGENDLLKVERGALLSGKSGVFFGAVPAERGKLNLSIAALGVGVPFQGSGEVARIVVRKGIQNPVRVRLESIDIRNINNEQEELEVPAEIETPFIPAISELLQNHPNPFNPKTTITYDVATSGKVTIQIFDVSGRLVHTLVNGHREVGRYHVDWDGKDTDGAPVRTGLYFYQMKAPGFEPRSKKMLLLK
jgi:hypothetical protein